jgi:hypothetical protein
MPPKRPSVKDIQAQKYLVFQQQAIRYMEGVYGKSVWFMAPETFDNVLIRWIRALAEGNPDYGEEQMALIETMIQEQRGGNKNDGHNA